MVARGAQQIGMRVEMVTRPGRGQNQRYRNDRFTDAVLEFLSDLRALPA